MAAVFLTARNRRAAEILRPSPFTGRCAALIIVRAGLGHNIQDRIEARPAGQKTPARSIKSQELSIFGIVDIEPRSDEKSDDDSLTTIA